MKLKQYPKYKKSNIDWIGKIPDEWDVKKLKFSYNIIGKTNIPASEGDDEGAYPFFTSGERSKFIDKPIISGEYIIVGDGGIPNFKYYNGKFSYSDHCFLLKSNKQIDSKFLFYFLIGNLDPLDILCFQGMGLRNLDKYKFNSFFSCFPSEDKQKIITSFLDKKTTNINNLLEKDKHLIELLKEKRIALINHVVTKGLNPKTKFKDSGIDWIGKIPDGWEVKKLKHCCDIKAQYGANCEPEDNPKKLDYRYVRITDVNDLGRLREDSFAYLSQENAVSYILKECDVLFARSGATVGKSYYYLSEDGKCAYAGYLIRYLTNKKIMNPKYLFYYSLSYAYKDWIKLILIQSTIENVSAEKYDNLPITTPPLPEQTQISEYLDKATSKINETLKKIEKRIELLEEYKKSLIHNVVTGKVDVRNM